MIDPDGRVGFFVRFLYGRLAAIAVGKLDPRGNEAGWSEKEWRQWLFEKELKLEDSEWEYKLKKMDEFFESDYYKDLKRRIKEEDERMKNKSPCP